MMSPLENAIRREMGDFTLDEIAKRLASELALDGGVFGGKASCEITVNVSIEVDVA